MYSNLVVSSTFLLMRKYYAKDYPVVLLVRPSGFINFSLFWEDFRTALFVTNNGFEWIIRSLISRRPVNKF